MDLGLLRKDFKAEAESLEALVAPLEDREWDLPTPAEGWSIRDQISHLAFFDEAGADAVLAPAHFAAGVAELARDVEAFMEAPIAKGRAMRPSEVLGWWREGRYRVMEAFEEMEGIGRVPWYGPPMSPASFISARVMETWAHGQDVADALGVDRPATERLRHIAFIGVRARRFSYLTRGLPEPRGEVLVELTGPAGDTWRWGEGPDSVRGSALDFCLVVTQRRHPTDTDLEVEGPLAEEWISIAQSFAGPPGSGRQPGQFPRVPR